MEKIILSQLLELCIEPITNSSAIKELAKAIRSYIIQKEGDNNEQSDSANQQ